MAESGEDAIGSVQNFPGGVQAPSGSNAVNFRTAEAPRTSAQQPHIPRKTINAAISKKGVQAAPKAVSLDLPTAGAKNVKAHTEAPGAGKKNKAGQHLLSDQNQTDTVLQGRHRHGMNNVQGGSAAFSAGLDGKRGHAYNGKRGGGGSKTSQLPGFRAGDPTAGAGTSKNSNTPGNMEGWTQFASSFRQEKGQRQGRAPRYGVELSSIHHLEALDEEYLVTQLKAFIRPWPGSESNTTSKFFKRSTDSGIAVAQATAAEKMLLLKCATQDDEDNCLQAATALVLSSTVLREKAVSARESRLTPGNYEKTLVVSRAKEAKPWPTDVKHKKKSIVEQQIAQAGKAWNNVARAMKPQAEDLLFDLHDTQGTDIGEGCRLAFANRGSPDHELGLLIVDSAAEAQFLQQEFDGKVFNGVKVSVVMDEVPVAKQELPQVATWAVKATGIQSDALSDTGALRLCLNAALDSEKNNRFQLSKECIVRVSTDSTGIAILQVSSVDAQLKLVRQIRMIKLPEHQCMIKFTGASNAINNTTLAHRRAVRSRSVSPELQTLPDGQARPSTPGGGGSLDSVDMAAIEAVVAAAEAEAAEKNKVNGAKTVAQDDTADCPAFKQLLSQLSPPNTPNSFFVAAEYNKFSSLMAMDDDDDEDEDEVSLVSPVVEPFLGSQASKETEDEVINAGRTTGRTPGKNKRDKLTPEANQVVASIPPGSKGQDVGPLKVQKMLPLSPARSDCATHEEAELMVNMVAMSLRNVHALSPSECLEMDKQSVKRLAWLRQDVQGTEVHDVEAYEQLLEILQTGEVMLVGSTGDGLCGFYLLNFIQELKARLDVCIYPDGERWETAFSSTAEVFERLAEINVRVKGDTRWLFNHELQILARDGRYDGERRLQPSTAQGQVDDLVGVMEWQVDIETLSADNDTDPAASYQFIFNDDAQNTMEGFPSAVVWAVNINGHNFGLVNLKVLQRVLDDFSETENMKEEAANAGPKVQTEDDDIVAGLGQGQALPRPKSPSNPPGPSSDGEGNGFKTSAVNDPGAPAGARGQ